MTNEEAINILKSKMDGRVDTSYEWAETVRMAIKALEQPERTGKWIPCSERLPEKDGAYICTARWSDVVPFRVTILDYGYKISDEWKDSPCIFKNGAAFGEMWDDEMDNIEEVIAWMPLPVPPEPYKGEQE